PKRDSPAASPSTNGSPAPGEPIKPQGGRLHGTHSKQVLGSNIFLCTVFTQEEHDLAKTRV
ncbi:MAG: hypothetical protein WBF15_09020, partial [Candidatus Sulfotelmatobacter sp.]